MTLSNLLERLILLPEDVIVSSWILYYYVYVLACSPTDRDYIQIMTAASEFTEFHGSGETLLRGIAPAQTVLYDGSEGYRASCLAKFHIPPSHGLLISIAGFLYAMSMHKFATRDPLSTSTGIQGLIDAFGMAGAFICILLVALRRRRQHLRSMVFICFEIFAFFAIASSWRSFNPSLSVVKGFLLLIVLGTCYLSHQAGIGMRYFRSIYWSYIALLVVGLLVGLLFPHQYPLHPLLTLDEYTGRNRLSVFDTYPGTMGEDAGLLLLMAPLMNLRSSWLSQTFLFIMNVLAGGKTSTALLCFFLLIRFIPSLRQWRSRRVLAIVVGTACIALFSLPSLVGYTNEPPVLAHAAESIYGTTVSADATTLDGRLALWAASVKLLPSAMFLGFGLDGIRDVMIKVASWSGATHNGYLELAMAGGLIGLSASLVALALIVLACFRAPYYLRKDAKMVAAYILVTSCIGNIFTAPSFIGLFGLLWIFYHVRYSAIDHRSPRILPL